MRDRLLEQDVIGPEIVQTTEAMNRIMNEYMDCLHLRIDRLPGVQTAAAMQAQKQKT